MNQTVLKNEKDFEEFKTWTLGLLRDGNTKDLCVTFTKKDGTERKMFCTLVEGRIPSNKHPKKESEQSHTAESSARVFDTEIGEWRSFRWDSVTKVEFDI